MMMSTAAFFSFFPLAVFPASTVATGRGCLELGSKAKVQGFYFFLLLLCTVQGKKRPKGMFGLGVFKEGMSENSTMEHKGDIINTEGETEHPKTDSENPG